MNRAFTIAAAAATFAAAGTASAQLIAYEGYDVPPYAETGLNGQNPGASATSIGWDGAWSVGTANLQGDAGTLTNAATAYDDLTTGKGQYIASTFDFFRSGNRKINSYAASDTYYMSMFVNAGGSFLGSGSREYATAGFTNFYGSGGFNNTSADNVFGLMAGFRGEGAGAAAGEADLILRARGASGDLEDTVLLSNVDSNTYHVLYKLEVNVGGGSADQVTFWVNPSDLSSEAAMTASAAVTGTVSTFSMDTNTRIDRFSVTTSNWARSMFWDENRFGYDLNSVTGIPTPAAAGLLGLGGLVAARRRRA